MFVIRTVMASDSLYEQHVFTLLYSGQWNRLKYTIPGHPVLCWNSKPVICWGSSAVITLHFVCLCVRAHYLAIYIHIYVCQDDKIPLWWIYPSIDSCDILLRLGSPWVLIPWSIPHTVTKTAIWLWWLVCHPLVIWFQSYGF